MSAHERERVRYSESGLFILSDGRAMQEAISNLSEIEIDGTVLRKR